MRCPKCHYISFDNGERCRNCGYEFALAVDRKDSDLPIQTGDEPIGPLGDFKLSDPGTPPQPRPITSSFDLPLFRDRDRADGEGPLIAPPAAPRAPLAVRRTNPAGARSPARAPIEEPELDLGEPNLDLEIPDPIARPAPPPASPPTPLEESDLAAPAAPRVFAGIIDTVIVAAISAVVLYLTLKVCGLGLTQIAVIPVAPFGSFLLLLAAAYFTLFIAANGQTIGKMAAGLKVIPADSPARRVSLSHALVRAAAYIVSALPAGLGFLPALFASDRRAFHDRLAATRVVKA